MSSHEGAVTLGTADATIEPRRHHERRYRRHRHRYVHALQGEHIHYGVLQQTLPDTLRWLWQGYPVR
jgi:hypothetical protein